MKKLLLVFGLLFSTLINAQTDTSGVIKNAIQVQPVVVNALSKDTCYQVTWSVFGINRNDTVSGANSYVQLYSRTGKRVQEMNVQIPPKVLAVWLDDKVIDDYILTFLGLKKRN